MKKVITYTVEFVYYDSDNHEVTKVPFITTEDYQNAYETAYEYVWAMGGTALLVERHNDKAKKVIRFESEGYIDDDTEVVVEEKVLLQLIK